MAMNKQGQLVLFGLMLSLTIIILAVALATPIRDFTIISMNQTDGDTIGLDCDNVSISDFDKGTCVIVDSFNWFFVGTLVALGGAVIGAKILFGG